MRDSASPGRTDRASIEISALPDEIYDAFADPDRLISWLPPGNMTGRVLEYNFCPAGRYRIELTYPDTAPSGVGERTDVVQGSFGLIQPNELIVQLVEFESARPEFGGTMILTWWFDRTATGTKVTVTAENVPPGISQADHDAGLRASLDNLARFVTSRRS